MHELAYIELSDLFDILSDQTSYYMKMLSEGATKDEFNKCREMITNIQSEIKSRQEKERNSAASGANLSYDAGHSPNNFQNK